MAKVDQIPDPPLAKPGERRERHETIAKKRIREAKQAIQKSLKVQKIKQLKARRRYYALTANIGDKREKVKDLNDALKGQKTTLVTGEQLTEAHPRVMEVLKDREVLFQANPGPQTEFLAAPEKEVFYGGARGGGKSFAMLVDPLRHCDKEMHRALLIRKTLPELRDLIDHSRRLYKQAYPGAKYSDESKVWRFPSGARIEFGYAENMADALRYQGQSYTWIGVDELPQYATPDIWNFLRSSLRSVDPEIPEYMRATGNPGNIGSHWVREMFIDPATWGEPFEVKVNTEKGQLKFTRRFIPAKLQDNPYLTQTDSYMIMLSSLPEVQRKQFLEGNWDAFENAAFPEFNRTIHVVPSFKIMDSWVKFRAVDWGYSSKACCLWFAVDYNGDLWVYKELYTHHLTADKFAQQVLEMSANEVNLRYTVLDVSTWQKRGDVGPSIAETMRIHGLQCRPSDKSPISRKNGKLEVHRRLMLKLDGKPSLYVFANCRNLIRTLPLLPLDENDMEDVDTEAEDHAYDALRYGCMSRPVNPQYYINLRNTPDKPIADKIFGY